LSDLVGLASDALLLTALVCGLALLLLAVVSVLVGLYKALYGTQVYVLPFRGGDERGGELMALFTQRLAELERGWTKLAVDIEDLRVDFARRTSEASKSTDATAPRPEEANRERMIDVAGGPRTTGEEVVKTFLDALDPRSDDDSLAGIDLGVVTVAGVSFAPQQLLALLRRLPMSVAKRRLHGTITKSGDDYLVSVLFEQRPTRRRERGYAVAHVVRISEDEWLDGLGEAAFHLETKRLARLREDREAAAATKPAEGPVVEPPAPTVSQTVALAEVEAESWEACEAFLMGHRAQLKHYQTGAAVDRDEALGHYARALRIQPSYTRAAYNCATLLYNRYLPEANKAAIRNFQQAAVSPDPRVAALAHAGLAMAYCQAINRFGGPQEILIPKAFRASQDALGLDPNLEEARFAVAWTSQVKGALGRALAQYQSVVDVEIESAAGRRIKSFALNNAGWIWLTKLKGKSGARDQAEASFQQALSLYPNKVVHANLAEIARRRKRYAEALQWFDLALELDREYVNARNERACLKIEMAAAATTEDERDELLDDALIDHARAAQLAGDRRYATQLETQFRAKVEKQRARLGPPAERLLEEIPTA
jgi:tetratricopeptide (TPR) repeat protein